MTRVKLIYCFVLLFIFGVQFAFAQYNSQVFVDDELLVKYKSGVNSASAHLMNAKTGATVLEEFSDLGWQRIKLSGGLSVNQALSFYKSSGEVESAQPNFYYHILNTANDERFSELYGLARISAPAAWDLTTGSSTTVVANIDTGISYIHEDLLENLWRNPGEIPGNGLDDDGNGFVDDYYGYDFFYNDPDPLDEGGHGTHTSGIIGATGNNSLGVVGVNWRVKIMAIKIYSLNGSDTTSGMLINAYNYVRMMKNRGVNIRVTNNSYGGCNEACGYDQATKDAIDALGEAGVLQVFAAGNSGRDVETTAFYPASYTSPSILSVAASDQNDNRAGFSNYGSKSVDIAAPGVGILSTYISSNSSYVSLSGTSMATPHVSGAAALLSSYNPSLSAASLKATLMNSVDKLSQWSGVDKSGGRLNVAKALQNPTVCTFAVSGNSQNIVLSGGSFSFQVTAPQNCDYSIISSADWITSSGGNFGSGGGTFNFTVPFNNTGLPRNGTITISGQTFFVSQASNCSYSLSSTSESLAIGGGSGSVNVSSNSGCAWTSASNDSWITVTNGTNGTGNGTVSYSVAANAGAARTGTVFIAGQIFTVNQTGAKTRKRIRIL